MNENTWIEDSRPFLEAVDRWYNQLPTLELTDVITDPDRAALLCVDLTVGFAYEGDLASPRVAGVVPPIVDLFRRAHEIGLRHFLLPQDAHEAEAVEFEAFAPHAVAGTKEAQTVPELLDLPFSNLFWIFPKNSINPFLQKDLVAWVKEHPGIDTYIAVGDCTDFCVYQMAMHLRLEANALGMERRVIVPANCVDTFHISVETAEQLGILPHHGDLIHYLFLHHMATNKIEVVRELV